MKDKDTHLFQKAAEGDEKAFEEIVAKYQHSVINTVYRIIGDCSEAEDIAQEIFFKIWKSASTFKGHSKFSTWLYRVAVNHCLNYRKKNKINTVPLENNFENISGNHDSDIEESTERKNKEEKLFSAMESLPKRQRIALTLSCFKKKSYREIADIMETSVSSVESLIFRAKKNLRKKIE